MTTLGKFSRLAAVTSAVVTFSGAYIFFNGTRNPARAKGGETQYSSSEEFEHRLLYKPTGLRWDSNWDMCDKGTTKPKRRDDGRVDEESNEIKPTAVRHLVFIRHGQYHADANNSDDKRLTKLGRQQAETTGQRLKNLNRKYTKLVCSTLIRAVETADIIAKHLPDVPRESCDFLQEGAPAPPDPPSKRWRPDKTFFQDGPRIEAAFRKHIHRADVDQVGDSVEIYVCHGNVIRYFVCRVLQFPPEGWLRMSIGHCGITWVTIKPNGRVSVRSMGDTGHLPPEQLSS